MNGGQALQLEASSFKIFIPKFQWVWPCTVFPKCTETVDFKEPSGLQKPQGPLCGVNMCVSVHTYAYKCVFLCVCVNMGRSAAMWVCAHVCTGVCQCRCVSRCACPHVCQVYVGACTCVCPHVCPGVCPCAQVCMATRVHRCGERPVVGE